MRAHQIQIGLKAAIGEYDRPGTEFAFQARHLRPHADATRRRHQGASDPGVAYHVAATIPQIFLQSPQ